MWTQKISMKASNAVGNSPRTFTRAPNCKARAEQRITANTRDLMWKVEKEKSQRREMFYFNSKEL